MKSSGKGVEGVGEWVVPRRSVGVAGGRGKFGKWERHARLLLDTSVAPAFAAHGNVSLVASYLYLSAFGDYVA